MKAEERLALHRLAQESDRVYRAMAEERYARLEDLSKSEQGCMVESVRDDDKQTVLESALTSYRLAQTPVSVEGLVSRGWVKFDDWIGTYDYPPILGLRRSGCEFYYGKERVYPRPQTMLDVQNLIERLSR